MKKYNNKAWLEKKYIVEDLTIADIADICSVSDSTIYQACQRNNIDTSPDNIEKNFLHKKYHKNKLSMKEIADICDVCVSTIEYYMKKYDIDRRKCFESIEVGNKYTNGHWLEQKYITENLSTTEIAEICGADPTTISRHLKENSIEIKEPSGKNHYNWKGGKSDTPHSSQWDKMRERTIERDFGKCRSCSLTRDEHKEKFDQDIEVHHKTPRSWFFEQFDEEEAHKKMNKLRNLITLCKQCHMHFERQIK